MSDKAKVEIIRHLYDETRRPIVTTHEDQEFDVLVNMKQKRVQIQTNDPTANITIDDATIIVK